MRALVRTLLAAGLLLAVSPAQSQERDESVRVATFNAYLLSPFFKCFNPNFADCLSQINGETETWANDLADTILADPDRFDIIAINEAWDEDAKSILVRRLRPFFPNFVRKVDADLIQVRGQSLLDILTGQPQAVLTAIFGGAPIGKINGEDSGLMLFANAKFRFLPLPNSDFKWGSGPTETLEASTSEVAFTLFEDCASPDCFSAKGAALVRLNDIRTGRIWNVVLTHMQADYPEDNEFNTAERRSQFAQVEKLIRTTLEPLEDRQRQGERLIMMGDLNVAPLTTGQAEWGDLFNSAGSFFSRPLYDAWARTTSPQYKGITNQNDHERLDYILSFPEPYAAGDLEGPVCAQHMTIPTDFRDLDSDHYLVHADLNIGNFHCSPQIADEVTLEPAPNPGLPPQEFTVIDEEGGTDVTQIKRPGQMQWYHVKKGEAGTYLIALTSTKVKMDVYAPDDLTTPIARYNKTTAAIVLGDRSLFIDTYVLPREFYIRVSGETRATTADYALHIKRNTCSSKAEACILQPGQTQGAKLTKASNPFGLQNEAWFAFDVIGTSDSGIDQTITLTAGGLPDPGNFKATLEDFTNTSGIATPVAFEDGTRRVFASQMGDGSTGYLVISQAAPTTNDVTVTAHLDTNLRLLDVFNLICIDETNPEFGSDDIFSEFVFDGLTMRAPSSGEVEFDCDDSSDEKGWAGAVGRPTITFVDKLGVKLLEEDDASANDPSRFQLVPALAGDDMMWDGRDNPLWWKFEGGEYRFTFLLRKRPNEPVK
jgi:endonuclease/exonuclease/phosphatase family metal-dependent hydrolase